MATTTKEDSEQDPNGVGWDGPDDPENPLNWPASRKWANITALSIMTVLTPLVRRPFPPPFLLPTGLDNNATNILQGSSMFAPGVPDIMADFNSTSPNLATFVVSVYVLGFAFGPLLAAPMSETYGRAICYNIANVAFIIFTVGTALSQNMGMLIGFRFLMGFAGSTPITNGGGSVSDMFPVEQRGKAMALWAMGPILGPCVGPVAGGYIVQSLGWRWVFWIIAIAAGVVSVACFFLVTETYHPTLLSRRVRRLQKETGNTALYSVLDDRTLTEADRIRIALIRPVKILFLLPPVLIMSLYIAVVFGIMYLLFSTITFVFGQQYNFSTGIVGLAFIPTGVGCMIGMVLFGALTDYVVKSKMNKGLEPVPEDRLPIWLTVLSGFMVPASLFWYGWTVETQTHWMAPLIGLAAFCFGFMGVIMCIQIYLIDSYIRYAASVVAAITVLRSIVGALLPLAGLSLYNGLGYGWGNSVLAFMSMPLAVVPVIFWKYGAKIRTKFNPKL